MTPPLSEARRIQLDAKASEYNDMTLSALRDEMRQRDMSWRGHHKKQ
jgi:predicted HTH domain antitoxin